MVKLSKWLLGAALLAGAQVSNAIPITGSLEFNGAGTFLSQDALGNGLDVNPAGYPTGGFYGDSSGDGVLGPILDAGFSVVDHEEGPVTGFDFNPEVATAFATGSLGFAYGVTGSTINLVDIDLHSLPQTEFTIDITSPLTGPGILSFIIEDGEEQDQNPGDENGFWDIGGNGYFEFICDGSDSSCEDETVAGTWSISNTGGFLVVGFNTVPAPSILALFGIGLLGLGVVRSRRQS